ncbi:MAG: cysteine dioxygenase family protein [Endozoicomonadaceae bacterium]|nr:cysteine dioxygenase family protein [Endozoicomonadaceae bacterium]MCY4330348.1 cysteine dioxygenase family protein [Endozoicomonadaceae bacterium]
MMSPILEKFIDKCKQQVNQDNSPIACVEGLIPEVKILMSQADKWIQSEHLLACDDHYARNVVYLDEKNELGLYVLVWNPGQWTAIHDHGTWGVVGILNGTFHERHFIRKDAQHHSANTDIKLVNTGSVLLSSGSLTSFIPDPDHIHTSGNSGSDQVISVHLYGHSMVGFNIYDLNKGERHWFNASK